jgi:hypothetical protein
VTVYIVESANCWTQLEQAEERGFLVQMENWIRNQGIVTYLLW